MGRAWRAGRAYPEEPVTTVWPLAASTLIDSSALSENSSPLDASIAASMSPVVLASGSICSGSCDMVAFPSPELPARSSCSRLLHFLCNRTLHGNAAGVQIASGRVVNRIDGSLGTSMKEEPKGCGSQVGAEEPLRRASISACGSVPNYR